MPTPPYTGPEIRVSLDILGTFHHPPEPRRRPRLPRRTRRDRRRQQGLHPRSYRLAGAAEGAARWTEILMPFEAMETILRTRMTSMSLGLPKVGEGYFYRGGQLT